MYFVMLVYVDKRYPVNPYRGAVFRQPARIPLPVVPNFHTGERGVLKSVTSTGLIFKTNFID